jgi:endonuclease-3
MITRILFERYKNIDDFAGADLGELEKLIFSCGLYHTKARDIIAAAKLIKENKFPETMEQMLKVPGVGRKIANLLMGEIYGKNDVIIADTHCIRLSNRLGYCKTKDPGKVEIELKKQIPPDKQFQFSHALVAHGRAICKAVNPACRNCIIEKYCIKADVDQKEGI